MAPSSSVGPHPSLITVATPFLFQQTLQSRLVSIGANPSREDTYRLSGVQWINEVRTALQLPVRTFSTAVIYYHKFRLVHKDSDYQFQDAAAAALFAAAKIEDTLKKSREILCAAHNLKVSPAEHISSDDAVSNLEVRIPRKDELTSFGSRSIYPQKLSSASSALCLNHLDSTSVYATPTNTS